MFFHKRTGTGSADLVHLKIHNFTVLDADVFAILSADLKHGIDFRHPMSSSLGLRSDLIPDSIRADALADTLPPGASHAHRRKAHRTEPFPDAGQPLADSSFRVTCGAQILKVYQFTVSTDQDKIGAGGTDVDAQRTALLREDTGGLRLRKISAGQQFQSGKPGCRGACCHCIVQQRIQLCQCKCTFCLACCTDGRFKTRFFRDDQFLFGQVEHIPDSPYHTGVAGHAAAEYHRFADRKPTHDGSFVVADHRIAQSQQNVRCGNAFLLAVNDIRFGKHGAASGKPRDALRLLNQRRIILQLAAHTGHLVFKERARAACTVFVDCELRCTALQIRDESRTLTADFNDRTSLRNNLAHTLDDSWDIPKRGNIGSLFQQSFGVAASYTERKRCVCIQFQCRKSFFQAGERPAVMHRHPLLCHCTIPQQHQLDRRSADIHTQRKHCVTPSRQTLQVIGFDISNFIPYNNDAF